jgi:hypothetical protein
MDAATRAELDALRVRAYGPAADIAGDPAALALLVALEELARPKVVPARPGTTAFTPPEPSTTADASRDSGTLPHAAAPSAARVVEILPAAERGHRPRWHVAAVALVAALTVPLGVTAAQQAFAPPEPTASAIAREALAFTNDPTADVLITVRIDGSFGDYVDIPSAGEVPLFPVEGLMTWVEPLGDYYGWKLWIGGARGAIDDENCLLLDGDGTMRANCVTVDLTSQGALLLSVPFDEILPAERPEGMRPEQSLGFWWGTDGTVKILLAPTPAA